MTNIEKKRGRPAMDPADKRIPVSVRLSPEAVATFKEFDQPRALMRRILEEYARRAKDNLTLSNE